MKRLDYYCGIGLLAGLLLLGNYSIECVKAQHTNVPLKVLQVHELDILDKSGRTKAILAVASDGKPELSLFTDSTKGVSLNRITSDSITMITGKEAGVVIQSKPLPQVGLFGSQSKTHALISLDENGNGSLLLLDKQGKVTTALPPKTGDPLYTP